MNPVIQVYTKSVYGNTLVYCANSAQAAALRTLTNGAKTLESRHLDALAALGFTVEQVTNPADTLATLRR